MVLSLVACSSFGGIKANFEKNGYTYVEDADSENTTKTITAELEEGNISCTAHLFKTDGFLGVDVYALVLEFGSDKDMQEALSERYFFIERSVKQQSRRKIGEKAVQKKAEYDVVLCKDVAKFHGYFTIFSA